MAYGPAEKRLVQVIRNTIKMRVWLLVFLLVALFVVWGMLKKGQKGAGEVEIGFCKQLVIDPYYRLTGVTEDSCDDDYEAIGIIDSTRRDLDRELGRFDLKQSTPESGAALLHNQQFLMFDDNKRRAYETEISFPYTNSPIGLNGVLIFELWPICAFFGICAAVAFSFKQTCYEIYLSKLINHGENRRDIAGDLILAELAAGGTSETVLSGEKLIRYKRPITLRPENAISAGLFLIVGVVSLALLSGYVPEFLDRGELLFWYYFCLYVVCVGLGFLLLYSRASWRLTLAEAIGGKAVNGWGFSVCKWRNFLRRVTIFTIPLETIVAIIGAISIVGSFCLPWDASFNGYRLF